MPSRYEGLGIVGIEAQANGLFTIVSEYVPKEIMQTGHICVEKIDNSNNNNWIKRIMSVGGRYPADEIYNSDYELKREVPKFIALYRGIQR